MTVAEQILAGLAGIGIVGGSAWTVFWKVKGRLMANVRDNTLQADFNSLHDRYTALDGEIQEMREELNDLRAQNAILLANLRITSASVQRMAQLAQLFGDVALPFLDGHREHGMASRLIQQMIDQAQELTRQRETAQQAQT